ncbi:hypothetical protein BLOT_007389 [Blomia tropicalis]|nr:hypothetical protein BLOT_007389 [Blomia tropicalis]
MNLLCCRVFRDNDCFCSRYDENRQTMFYCGFFTTLAGFIWFVIGFSLKCAFFTQAFGQSVVAVAFGIMVVGIMVLVLGICFTLSIICSGKSNNKTGCISASTNKMTEKKRKQKKGQIYFHSPLDLEQCEKGMKKLEPFRHESFSSSTDLNPSSSSSSSTNVSSTPGSASSAASYKSNIAIIS